MSNMHTKNLRRARNAARRNKHVPKTGLREMLFVSREEMFAYVQTSYEKVRQMYWDATRGQYVVKRIWEE